MTILTRITPILLFFIFASLFSLAQERDSVRSAPTADTTSKLPDTTAVKDGRLQTAGKVWKGELLGVPGDFVQMGKVFTKDWRVTAACVAGISLVVLADKPVTQWYQDNVEKNVKYKLPNLPGEGNSRFFYGNDAYLNYSLIGLYGGSLIANYKTGQEAALNSMKALVYSYLIAQVGLKAVFARERPDLTLSDGKPARKPYTDDPYDFFKFRRISFSTGPYGTSFPSMHATAYFAVAKVMAMEFHNYWIPYTAITFVFFADVDAHQHWVGDMVAGGLLGTVIGQGIVSSSRLWEKKQKAKKEEEKRLGLNHRNKIDFNYQLLPAISSQMTGLTLFVSL
jgi:membrane-associated phospholipid phosphatase